MSEALRINKCEVASELAHSRTKIEIGCSDSAEMYAQETEHTFVYKDEVQDVFNKWYDYYLTKLEELGQRKKILVIGADNAGKIAAAAAAIAKRKGIEVVVLDEIAGDDDTNNLLRGSLLTSIPLTITKTHYDPERFIKVSEGKGGRARNKSAFNKFKKK